MQASSGRLSGSIDLEHGTAMCFKLGVWLAEGVKTRGMRLWSLHPSYLDRQGLIALWREALLAQKVLAGNTKGYKFHPQLIRFRQVENPLALMGAYLGSVADEAAKRGYCFDRSKILITPKQVGPVPVHRGQLVYEFSHLMNKLKLRDPQLFTKLEPVRRIRPHPIFRSVRGKIHDWERVAAKGG